jgi:MFS family permease
MSDTRPPGAEPAQQGSRRLMVLLAMAMFVLVVDTSLMNVSISAVIEDLDTTASGVQSAIALEALVSAAFILINSKVGDLIGRKRAYVIGLWPTRSGALAMTLAQSLTAIIIFWAIIGGLGASLLLPAMQSLIHGNFSGTAQKQAYALIGAAAAIAAAVGPLLGGFVTTYLSWRVGFALEVVIIAVVLSRSAWSRTSLHRVPQGRQGRGGPVGRRHGRRGARHPRLAGGRRVRRPAHGGRRDRARVAGLVALRRKREGR